MDHFEIAGSPQFSSRVCAQFRSEATARIRDMPLPKTNEGAKLCKVTEPESQRPSNEWSLGYLKGNLFSSLKQI